MEIFSFLLSRHSVALCPYADQYLDTSEFDFIYSELGCKITHIQHSLQLKSLLVNLFEVCVFVCVCVCVFVFGGGDYDWLLYLYTCTETTGFPFYACPELTLCS